MQARKSRTPTKQDCPDASRRALLKATGAGLLLMLADTLAEGKRKSARKGKRAAKRDSARVRVSSGPISGESLFRDVISYYNIGEHRAGTEADLQTSDWIARELRTAGVPSTFQRFTFPQFFPSEVGIVAGGNPVRAFPLWRPKATGPIPINSQLVAFDPQNNARAVEGRIALVRFRSDVLSALSREQIELVTAAAKARAAAIVAMTESQTGEIVALNVTPAVERWPVPVVLVGARDDHLLDAAVKKKMPVSLLLNGKDEPRAEARNVIGRISRGEKLIVVSTPQSGWFRCAAERGPGVALFLGLARWAAKLQSGPGYLFVSTSGHELGGLGIQAFLNEFALRREQVLCWLHLGAGIAAFAWEETASGPRRLREADSRRSLMASPELLPQLSESFAGQPGLTPTAGRSVGELEFIFKAGYRAFGIAAAHRFHHTPADSPEMTGPELLEPVATALVKVLGSMQ